VRRLAILGLALTIVGVVLALGFWPLASVSAAHLLAAQSGNTYVGYAPGERITIHAKVLDVSYAQFFGTPLTQLQLDSGDPNNPVSIYVQGDARSVVSLGEVIFASAVLQTVFGGQYWQIATPADVHPAWIVDVAFDATVIVGVILLAVAAFRNK
jgi:hypothetical protein